MGASGHALATAGVDDEDNTHQLHFHHIHHHSDGEGGPEDPCIHRSYSMPPAMFEAEGAMPQLLRNRERAGICIQRSTISRLRMLESQSEDELTTSGERGGDIEDERGEVGGGGGGGEVSDCYPRGRRNAFRGGARVTRRATCAADGSVIVAARRSAAAAHDRPG